MGQCLITETSRTKACQCFEQHLHNHIEDAHAQVAPQAWAILVAYFNGPSFHQTAINSLL